MRDNSMVGLPPNSLTPEPLPSRPLVAGGGVAPMMIYSDTEIGFLKSIFFSLAFHVGLVGFIWLTLMILQFLGINLLTFDRPEHVRDIEFQLVDSPIETPRNPKTKNRAEHNSRSGGEKIPNVHEAQPQRTAGQTKPQPKPRPMVAQAQTKPQPVQQQPKRPSPQKPQPQPKSVAVQPNNQQKPTPPKPIVRAPKPSTNRMHVAAVPNPLAPIRVPSAPGPVANTGPVVRGPSGGGSPSGSGSSVGPATMPGQFSGGGKPSAGGGPSGQGGRSGYSQYGSPGGGGGKPGVDALAEPDFGPYLAELQRRIRRNWIPPEDREDKTVILLFTIAKDGRLLNIQTKRSSGYGNADQAAKAAVERSAPFRPLPSEYRSGSINVEFTFDYNVYTGRSGGISKH
jgi:TonB family protein